MTLGMARHASCLPVAPSSKPDTETMTRTIGSAVGLHRTLCFSLLFLGVPVGAQAAGFTYYVAKNGNDLDGLSAATAFTTIQKAADVAKAGDTVIVAPGVYQEFVQNKNNGTQSARIRFVSQPRWGAKIAPTKDAPAYWTSFGAYVDIEGFEFDGKLNRDHAAQRGIIVHGTHSRVIYNRVYLLRACTEQLYYRGGVGITTIGYETNIGSEINGNIIKNTRVLGCSLPTKVVNNDRTGTEAAGYGIYHSTPFARITNNIIFDFRIGIHLWHNPTEATVSHNLVFRNGNLDPLSAGVGIIFGCGDKPYLQCKNIIVSNNIFMNNLSSVFTIREYGNNASGTNKILNNILYMNESKLISTVDQPIVSGNLIDVNPKLVNFKPDGSGNYRLVAGSPAIDAATAIGMAALDIDQRTRPAGGAADIGPYEYFLDQAAPSAPTTLSAR